MKTPTKKRPASRAKVTKPRADTAPTADPPTQAPAATPAAEPSLAGLWVDFDEVLALAGRLGTPKHMRALTREDPRFPAPLFGRGQGKRELWSRIQVQAYFQRLAEEGPITAAA